MAIRRSEETDGTHGSVTSVFVPPYAHQGQEMSCHVLWNRTATLLECEVSPAEGLSLIHIYNVPPEGVHEREGHRAVALTATSENGYIGFVLKSDTIAEPTATRTVAVTLRLNGGGGEEVVQVNKAVTLFRPDLELARRPRTLGVRINEKSPSPELSDHLVLQNNGLGTAYVRIRVAEDDSSKVQDFFDEERKTREFVTLLCRRFSELEESYPSHLELLREWGVFVRHLGDGEMDEAMKGVPKIQEGMRRSQRSDPLFYDDLVSGFQDSFRMTFTAEERFTAWVKGFESMQEQRVVLLNPWESVKLRDGPTDLMFSIQWFDQLGREYAIIPNISLSLSSNATGLLPYHELFVIQGRTAHQEEPAGSVPD